MAEYLWSTLSDGQTIAPFDPNNDRLRFDLDSINAASVVVVGNPGSVSFSFEGKTVNVAMTLAAVTTSNVTFVNASRLRVGDDTTGVAADDAANVIGGSS